jgi:light-regulated signal transduction histidine kinase (bacteriophytochrome)
MPERFQIKHRGLRYEYYRLPSLRPMGLDFELRGTRKDGSEFPIDIMLSPLETADGKLVLSVIRDLTRRRENEAKILDLNRQLEEQVKELQALNTSLEAFSYSVSHDLRAPLRAIDGFSRILSEKYAGVLDDEADRMLNVIAVKCHQMGELIDDLLAFSRIGRCPILHSEMDMTELARSAVEEMRFAEPTRQIQVMIGELPTAIGDRNLVRQVFANLVSNAWKFTRHAASPHVEIGSYEDGCAQVYFVKDNGIGFDSRYANKLFGVFQRLHSRDEFEGTGIGLALVKGIVERHGGKAWAAGRVGDGAEFYFTLGPAATSPIPV